MTAPAQRRSPRFRKLPVQDALKAQPATPMTQTVKSTKTAEGYGVLTARHILPMK